MRLPCTIFLILSFLLLSLAGCHRKNLPADLPPLHTVHVMVLQDGKPLPGAVVSLTQMDGAAKWPAMAETEDDGMAKKFYTNGMYEGVVEGKFKVCVRKIERERKEEEIEIPPEPKDPFEKYQWRQKYIDNKPPSVVYDLVEKKYADTKTTPHEITVTSGKNEFSVDVGKGVRILYKR